MIDRHPRRTCDVCGKERRANSMLACRYCGLSVCAVCSAFQRDAQGRFVGHEDAEHRHEIRRQEAA